MPNATYPCAKRDCSAPGNILCAGNHKCCVCKKPVHAAFCSKEFEQIRDAVRDKFMNKETGQPPEKVGIAMDVCHTCIEKAEAKIIAAAFVASPEEAPQLNNVRV